jgi:hypothetical protein
MDDWTFGIIRSPLIIYSIFIIKYSSDDPLAVVTYYLLIFSYYARSHRFDAQLKY